MTDETLSHVSEPAAAIEGNANPPAPEPVNLQEPEIESGPEPVAQAEPDDFEEIEWSGRTFRGPKGLKDGVLMHADYTRKTQATAERGRELDAREAQIAQQAKATDEELGIRANLHHVNGELKRLESFDWNAYQAMRREDPLGADEAWQYVQHLKGQKAEAERQLGDRQRARFEETQRETAKRFEDTNTFKKTIPGWTPEMDSKIIDFAKSEGVTSEQLAGVMSPAVYKILNLARLGADLLSKQSNPAPKPLTPAPQPLAVVGAKSSPTAKKSLADMDMEEYVAARKAGRKG